MRNRMTNAELRSYYYGIEHGLWRNLWVIVSNALLCVAAGLFCYGSATYPNIFPLPMFWAMGSLGVGMFAMGRLIVHLWRGVEQAEFKERIESEMRARGMEVY